MSLSPDKTRIQVTVSRDLLKMIDDFARRTGMSRSAVVSAATAEKLGTQKVLEDSILEAAEKIMREQQIDGANGNSRE